jgi:transcriptional regulator with XRE-family HTH domain
VLVAGELEDIGTRLREERDRVGISQRELARRIGLSASMISQIESGQSKPSVSTLYAIVTELGVSVDDMFRGSDGHAAAAHGAGEEPSEAGDDGPVVRSDDRHVIDLDSGVRWERLTSHQHEDVDFLHVVYDVGGSSASDTMMMRHPGREYGIVISGQLGVQLGFEQHKLGPGDSIAFDSTQPHRLWNLGEVPVEGVWFVVGRDGQGHT